MDKGHGHMVKGLHGPTHVHCDLCFATKTFRKSEDSLPAPRRLFKHDEEIAALHPRERTGIQSVGVQWMLGLVDWEMLQLVPDLVHLDKNVVLELLAALLERCNSQPSFKVLLLVAHGHCLFVCPYSQRDRMRSCKLCTPAPASSPSSSSAIRSACHPGWMLRRCLISFCTWTLILCSRHMPQTSPTTRGPSCSTPGKRWLACSARCISPWTMRSLSRSTRSRPLKLRACCASATPSRPPRTSTCCCITCPPFLSATAGPSASSPCRPWRRAWAPTACAGGTAPCATPSPGSLPPLCRCCSATTCCCMRAPEALRSSASPTRPTTRHTPLLALLHCAHIAFRLRDLCTAPWSSPQQPPHCLPRRLTMMTK
eukprot:m.108756 g.108756  ORF g.108756 m.108756 type:complete len:370 (+) comp14290_c0_seq2:1248-2357(+)